MYRIVGKAEEINALARVLLADDSGTFENISQRVPKFVPAELGFLRLVSWLFILYFEAGRIGVHYLSQRFALFQVDPTSKHLAHLEIVQRLRTYTQHNLNSAETHDKLTMEQCQTWFAAQSGTAVPDSEQEWNLCLSALLVESIGFLEALLCVVRLVEKDESRDLICRDWKFRKNRYHPPHQFEALVPKIAVDMGHEYIDAERLVRRNYEKWVQNLRAFSSEYAFENEARKLIEHAILNDLVGVLPITGEDLIRAFQLEPGRGIGQLLEEARRLYQQQPCSKPALLELLRPSAKAL